MNDSQQIQTSKAIAKILDITENSIDGWKYLQYFRSLPYEKFALIYPDIDSVVHSWDSLLHDLRVLWQLELYPVVVVPSVLPGYMKQFLKKGLDLEGYFPIQFLRKTESLKEKIIKVIYQNKKIPILLTNENTEKIIDKITEFLKILEPSKLIFIREKSGIWTKSNEKLSIISLSNDYDKIQEKLDRDEKIFLNQINQIFKNISYRRFTISITSASLVLRELFTVKGSGTLVKKGNIILHSNNINYLDKIKIINLVESAFGKKCNKNFIESLENFDWEILYESHYQACALLKKTSNGMFLSKFAVDAISRGEGIGREIWDKMKELYPFVFWRSRVTNPITSWYRKEATGMVRTENWVYFWLQDKEFIIAPELYRAIMEYLQNLPEDWEMD